MADDIQVLKSFLNSTKNKAAEVQSREHLSADVRNIIGDLLQLCENFDELFAMSQGQTADARILKKKFDQIKAEQRTTEGKMELIKKSVVFLVDDIKTISTEASTILKRHEANTSEPNYVAAMRIRSAAHKMAEIIVEMSKT